MKKAIIACLIFFLSIVSTLTPALMEERNPVLPTSAANLIETPQWEDYALVRLDGYGNEDSEYGQYALVLKKEEHNVLLLIERKGNKPGYEIALTTDKAIYQGALLPDLHFDTGVDSLFYTYEYEDGPYQIERYHTLKQAEEWTAPYLFLYEWVNEEGLYPETVIGAEENGILTYSKGWSDENDNPVRSQDDQKVPGIKTAQALADFDIAALPHSFEEALIWK